MVPVKWLSTVPREIAFRKKGFFTNQNFACKLRDSFTLDELAKHFSIEGRSNIVSNSNAALAFQTADQRPLCTLEPRQSELLCSVMDAPLITVTDLRRDTRESKPVRAVPARPQD